MTPAGILPLYAPVCPPQDKRTPMSIITRIHALLVRIGLMLQCPLLLVIRLYWGWQFFLTGRGKLMHLDQTTEFFHTLHIPFPYLNAWIVGLTECFGGLLLLSGLGARAVAAALAFDMIIAYLTADFDKVKTIFSNPDKFLGADPFLFMLATMIIFAFGPGVFSL